jgi:hypothetical protein
VHVANDEAGQDQRTAVVDRFFAPRRGSVPERGDAAVAFGDPVIARDLRAGHQVAAKNPRECFGHAHAADCRDRRRGLCRSPRAVSSRDAAKTALLLLTSRRGRADSKATVAAMRVTIRRAWRLKGSG